VSALRGGRLALAGALVLVLAGCASTSSVSDSGREVDMRRAASDNVRLGVAYMNQGNLALAKEKLDRAARQDPKIHEVYWAMASLSERLNRPEDAARNYKAAFQLAPDNPELSNTYAVFLCRNGNIDEALPMFDKVIANRLYQTPWAVATNAAVCLRAEKRMADAVPYLKKAVYDRPNFVPAVVELADLQLASSKPEEARATVDTYLAAFKSPEVLLLGVRAAVALGQCQAAESTYARTLRRDFANSPQTSLLPQYLANCASRTAAQ
jgi:type IV pilus assembly protein PilF